MGIESRQTIIDLRDVALTLPSRAGPVEILRQVTLSIPAGSPWRS